MTVLFTVSMRATLGPQLKIASAGDDIRAFLKSAFLKKKLQLQYTEKGTMWIQGRRI